MATLDADGLRAALRTDQHNRRLAARGARVPNFEFTTPAELGKVEWDRSLPTLQTGSRWDVRHAIPVLNSARTTWEKIVKENPLLDIDSITKGQFVVAGGMVLSHLLRSGSNRQYTDPYKFTASDVDLFLVKGALTPDEALVKLLQEIRLKIITNTLYVMAEAAVELVVADAAKIQLKTQKLTTSKKLVEEWCQDYLQEGKITAAVDAGGTFRDILERTGLFKEYNVKGEGFWLPEYPLELIHQIVTETTWITFFRKELGSKLNRMAEGPRFNCVRNRNAVSIEAYDPVLRKTFPTIQIILRVYDHPEHIPLGFDLGSCAVALQFFEKEPLLITSEFGRLALLTGHNVIDPTRVSPSYQRRIRKYFERGFSIVFPDLDLEHVPKDNLRYNLDQVIVLPSVAFSVTHIAGQKMFFSDFKHTWNWCGGEDYGPSDIRSSSAASHNLRMVRKGDLNFLHILKAVEDPVTILTALPHMQIQDIINYFAKLQIEIWHKGRLNVSLFKSTFGAADSGPALEEDELDLPDLPTLEVIDFIESEDKKKMLEDALEARERAMIEVWTKKISQPEYTKLTWMTENASSQAKNYGSFVDVRSADLEEREQLFTSSVQPAFMTAQEWYGEYYRGAVATRTATVNLAADEAVGAAWRQTAFEEAAAAASSSLSGACTNS
jgi:hypothetical protein